MKGSETCSKLAGMATTIMEARQRGAPMSKVMSATVKTISNPKVEKLLRSLIIEAYSLPNYSSSKYEERAVRKFENTVYLECIKEASN